MYVMVQFIVWRTKAGRRTGRWWMYRLKSGCTEAIRGLGHEKGYDYINKVSIADGLVF